MTELRDKEARPITPGKVTSAPSANGLSPHVTVYGLSPYETTVLGHMCGGLFDEQIAQILSTSKANVAEHVAAIVGKMDARSRTEAAVRAIREELFA